MVQKIIQNIMDNLTATQYQPNKTAEIEAIKKCKGGIMKNIKLIRVDLKLILRNNGIYLIGIKTAKPNKGGFKEFKRTLLEWITCVLAENPKAKVNTLIAIPYNIFMNQNLTLDGQW